MKVSKRFIALLLSLFILLVSLAVPSVAADDEDYSLIGTTFVGWTVEKLDGNAVRTYSGDTTTINLTKGTLYCLTVLYDDIPDYKVGDKYLLSFTLDSSSGVSDGYILFGCGKVLSTGFQFIKSLEISSGFNSNISSDYSISFEGPNENSYVGFMFFSNSNCTFRVSNIKLINKSEERDNKFLSAIARFFQNLWDNLLEAFTNIGVWFSQLSSSIGGWFSDSNTNVTNNFSSLFSSLTTSFTNIGNWFSQLGTNISGFFNTLWGNINSAFNNITLAISNFFTTLWSNLNTAFNNIRQAISNLVTSIGAFFTNLADDIKSFFIPDDDFFDDYKENFDTLLEEHLGVVYSSGDFIVQLVNKCKTLLSSTTTDDLYFPEIKFNLPGSNQQVNLINRTAVSFEFLNSGIFQTLYGLYKVILNIILIFCLIKYAEYVFDKTMRN